MIRLALLAILLATLILIIFRHVHADESPVTSCGPNRGHDCHCPRMVQRRRNEEEDKCRAIMDKEENARCLAAIETTCQMVAHPRYVIPPGGDDEAGGQLEPDTCFKYCKYQDLCFCNDTRCTMQGDPITPDHPVKPPKMQPLPKGKK